MSTILVIDDEQSIRELLEITFRKEGHRVEVAATGEAAQRKLRSRIFDIVISDVRLPDMTGLDVLKFCREISPGTLFIIITGVPALDTAIDALNSGADLYVIKGNRLLDELRPAVHLASENQNLKREAGVLRREVRRMTGFGRIIGSSPRMREIFELIHTIAPQSSRVLITGESGTGKELVARAIHENSARAAQPFVAISCGAFPEALLESELFGYVKGAFTGATENRRGLFQAAHGGTLFMDEIGNMSTAMQVKFYRVLQEGAVRPVGSTAESEVDVRVIAATNKDLEVEMAQSRFREDLYYRLSVIPVHLPPLRERSEDVPLLARFFLERYRALLAKPVDTIEPDAMCRLEAYAWPGNVRELENTIERSVALEPGTSITLTGLPERISGNSVHHGNGNGAGANVATNNGARTLAAGVAPGNGSSPITNLAPSGTNSDSVPAAILIAAGDFAPALGPQSAASLKSAPAVAIDPSQLPISASFAPFGSPVSQSLPPGGLDLEDLIRQTERTCILAALERVGGVRVRAARLLNMSYRSFRHYAKKHGV
jgi:two-component system response regulator PilR (NtrC family)